MAKRPSNLTDNPVTTLGLAAQRVVTRVGLLYEQPEQSGATKREGADETHDGEGVEVHQRLPMPRAMTEALEVAMRPTIDRQRATRREFQGLFRRPKVR